MCLSCLLLLYVHICVFMYSISFYCFSNHFFLMFFYFIHCYISDKSIIDREPISPIVLILHYYGPLRFHAGSNIYFLPEIPDSFPNELDEEMNVGSQVGNVSVSGMDASGPDKSCNCRSPVL